MGVRKNYTPNNTPPAILQEAAVAYLPKGYTPNIISNYLSRSIELMGLQNTKPYSSIENEADFISLIRDGVPMKALENIVEIAGLTLIEISNIIRTSDRTLRRYTAKHKLNAEQSERVIELAKLYSRGEEVFGNLDAFKEWMNSTVLALGNKKPISFLDTSMGIEMLLNELGRIEHGIFA